MKKNIAIVFIEFFALTGSFSFHKQAPDLPKVWTDERMQSLFLPMADSSVKMHAPSAAFYYQQTERVMYKSYPMYMPGREPKGYYDWLKQQEPQIAFNPDEIKSEADYIKAGEVLYDFPTGFGISIDSTFLNNINFWKEQWQRMGVTTTKEGIIPQLSIIIKNKGEVTLGGVACGHCHTKVMPDGSVLKGGQGNFPFDQYNAAGFVYDQDIKKQPDSSVEKSFYQLNRLLFAAPWIKSAAYDASQTINLQQYVAIGNTSPAGVMTRHGSMLNAFPTTIPDLFNVKERKYLDHTGLVKNRDIYDLMLYATLNQESDFLVGFNDFAPIPHGEDGSKSGITRFSDIQLLALAKFIYSLKPPSNPNNPNDELAVRGKKIFQNEGCDYCHAPPLYTNNMLIPVTGFKPPSSHFALYDVDTFPLNTNPGLALYTRRGTGYYKVPSLIGVWNRTALQHSGYYASLEALFDKARLKEDYVPTGFKPYGVKTMACTGHEFGLDLNKKDKAALIAFLRTL
jgi:cytochrome c2